jgi:hypothetical protein
MPRLIDERRREIFRRFESLIELFRGLDFIEQTGRTESVSDCFLVSLHAPVIVPLFLSKRQ